MDVADRTFEYRVSFFPSNRPGHLGLFRGVIHPVLNMFTNFSNFVRDESGAVSASWTVLTASVALMSVVTLAPR